MEQITVLGLGMLVLMYVHVHGIPNTGQILLGSYKCKRVIIII